MSLLSAAELKASPAYQNLEWELPPTKEGKCAVAKGRGGLFDLWYEVHGVAEGGIKLVVSLTQCYFRPVVVRFYCWILEFCQ